jgi:NitT/TauT family transport system ATP-binding protein
MILSLKNITKKYDGRTVIDNFSYTFEERGIVALTGASGVGKTTLLKIIIGLDKKHGGERCVDKNVKFSVAFQEHRLLPHLTALENVLYVAFEKATDESAFSSKELLRSFGFSDDDMNLYPSELSGGMKQRVSLARAFLHECDVLILDEPTKELDAALVKTILDFITEYAKEHLVIIVSHNKSDIEYLNPKIIELK